MIYFNDDSLFVNIFLKTKSSKTPALVNSGALHELVFLRCMVVQRDVDPKRIFKILSSGLAYLSKLPTSPCSKNGKIVQ